MTIDLSTPISRRGALKAWMLGVAPIVLLTACGSQAPATPTTAPESKPLGVTPVGSPSVPVASPAASPMPVGSPVASPVAAGTCVLTPEQTEGPYYIDSALMRSDITEGKPGVPLHLNLVVQTARTCQPLAQVTVELWHCDALGVYSGFNAAQVQGQGEPPRSDSGNPAPKPSGSPPAGGPPPGGANGQRQTPVNAETFLRGGQVSDANGRVTFQTIYPGWYTGRTTHIHVKVHVSGQEVHTGQLYFDEAITDLVYTQPPYSTHTNRDTVNLSDSIYRDGGEQTLLALSQVGTSYTGNIVLTVQA